MKAAIQCVSERESYLNESMTTLSNQTASGDALKASVSCGRGRVTGQGYSHTVSAGGRRWRPARSCDGGWS